MGGTMLSNEEIELAFGRIPYPEPETDMDDTTLKITLADLGMRDVDGLLPAFRVMLDALAVMDNRNAQRQNVWARSGIRGQVFHLFSKAERAFTKAMRGELPSEDDFLDAINYAVFGELLRRGPAVVPGVGPRMTGEWPWEG